MYEKRDGADGPRQAEHVVEESPVATRNPAFRVAIAGLALAVILCLIGAVSLLGTPLGSVAQPQDPVGEQTAATPIRVATAGSTDALLGKHPSASRPVPDHSEEWPTERNASNATEARGAWSALPGSDLDQLRGEVSELARSQLEAQLVAIRDAETLLVRHETTRDLETLVREVEALKASVAERSHQTEAPEPKEVSSRLASPVRVQESRTSPGKFDVDADGVALGELVGQLAPIAGWNIVYGMKSEDRITCHWRSVDVAEALTQLLRVHHLQTRTDGDLTLVEELQFPPAPPVEDSEWKSTTTRPDDPEAEDKDAVPYEIEITPARPSKRFSPPVEQEARSQDGSSAQQSREPQQELIDSLVEVAAPETSTSMSDAPLYKPELSLDDATLKASALNARAEDVAVSADNVINTAAIPRTVAEPPLSSPSTDDSTTSLAPGPLPAFEAARPAALPVTADLPVAIENVPAPPAVPEVMISATVLQVHHPLVSSRGLYHRGIFVSRAGPCPQCGETHAPEEAAPGHFSRGWQGLADGVATGVSPLSPKLIADRIHQLGDATLIAIPQVRVPSGRIAEIGLTEQQGYRRYHFKNGKESEEVGFLEGGLQLSLRPTLAADGSLSLELKPRSTIDSTRATEESTATTVQIPLGSSVILGGLYFDMTTTDTTAKPTGWIQSVSGQKTGPSDLHEVIVIIEAQPAANP